MRRALFQHRSFSTAPAPTAVGRLNAPTYMRSLPDTCVHWSSAEGRRRYAEALRGGTLEAHLTLAAHFRTQSELVYCGQGTLAMALSALAPPLGGARWSEGSMVDCCRPREEVLTRGISLDTFACLARCCGA